MGRDHPDPAIVKAQQESALRAAIRTAQTPRRDMRRRL
jgi:hypothetical protein